MSQTFFKNESHWTRTLCSKLDTLCGAFCIPLVGSEMQRAGLPDRHISHTMWNGHLEMKVDDNCQTTLQKITMQNMLHRRTPCLLLRLYQPTGVVTIEVPEPGVGTDRMVRLALLDWAQLEVRPLQLLMDLSEVTPTVFDVYDNPPTRCEKCGHTWCMCKGDSDA